MTDQREAVARIIREQSQGHCEVVQYHKIYAVTESGSLAIADVILSTLGSQAVEPEREGDLRERLCLLFETATLDRDPHTNLNTGTSAEQMADLVLATLPASPIRRRAEEVIELHDPRVIELAGKLFKAEHPNSEWSPGRAAICWFVRAETALNALASAPKASDGESGRG